MLARALSPSWSAIVTRLDQLRRDVATVSRRARGYHASPLVTTARALVVLRVIRETPDSVTLVLRAPGGQPFAFQAGQFFTLLTEIDGELVPRNYSASNAPGEAELHLTIKKKAGGRVSPVLCSASRTRPGDRLRVLGPFGSFVLPAASSSRRLILVAGGAGITPLVSIARTVLANEPAAEIALVYANRREEDVILASELRDLASAHGTRLTLLHVLEQPPALWDGHAGRLDRHAAARALDTLALAAHPEAMFFVCGPDAMRDEVLAALAARGIAEDAIRIERFAIGPRPQVSRSPAAAAVAPRGGPRPISIRVKGRTHHAIASPGATVLEVGLAAGADMPFSCGVGGCGACRVKVIAGDVEIDEPNCLSDAERAAGYVLACVGRPCGPCSVEVPDR